MSRDGHSGHMNDLSRFSVIDAYTLEELKRDYQYRTPNARIGLIEGLYLNGIIPPYEVARLVVEDQHVQVRQWMARHARHLDYREAIDDNPANGFMFPERNLVDIVRRDPDEFVRACLYENPDVFAHWPQDEWMRLFASGSHLERLAMVRNPNMQGAHNVLEAIFDPDDSRFEMTLDEREQLVNALLISRQVLSEKRRKESSVFAQPWDARLFSRLWRLVNKWPKDAKIRRNIHLYVGTTIKTKAGIYRQCKQAALRVDILNNIDPDDCDTLELGMKDSDNVCRYLAHTKTRSLNAARFEMVLNSGDVHALAGLAENKNLSIKQLEQVKERLFTLGAHEEARWASENIEYLRTLESTNDPDKLFGIHNKNPELLTDKINFIGRQLVKLQHEIDYLQDLAEAQRAAQNAKV